MRRMFRVVYSEIRGLHQSAYILAIFTLASQILALLRDRLFAHTFGAGAELDLYYAAFRIPDILFVLFASMLSVYVLIPFVSERLGVGDEDGARRILSSVLSGFIYAYALSAALVWYFADPIVALLFPGFSATGYEALVILLRILLIQPLLLGISNLFGVVTQLNQRFILYAVSPLLYNIGIIIGVALLYPLWGLPGVVLGVVLGALLHLAIQIPFITETKIRPSFNIRLDVAILKEVLMSSIPRALTLSLGQIVLLAYAGIASVMAIGSVSIFQFAWNLQSVPLAIIGVSYSVAAFPILARLYSEGDHDAFIARVSSAMRHIIFWTVPAIALIIVVRAQIVRVVLGTGAFDWDDTRLTAAALALFSFSLLAQSLNLLIVRAFYAGGNTRTPFIAAVVGTAATLLASLALYVWFLSSDVFSSALSRIFRVEGVSGTEVLMLPLGYSIVALLHACYLSGAFARQHKLPLAPLATSLLRSVVAALGGAFMAYIALNAAVAGIRTETFIGILIQGALASIAGLATIALLLFLMRSPELSELWATMRRRFLPSRFVGSDNVDTLGL